MFAGLRQKIRSPNACRPHVQGGRIDLPLSGFEHPQASLQSARIAFGRNESHGPVIRRAIQRRGHVISN